MRAIWTYEACFEEAKKYTRRQDFKNYSVGAYTRALKSKWLDDYKWFEKPKTGQHKWTREACYDEAKKYTSRIDFQNGSSSAYAKALRSKWLDDYTWFDAPHIGDYKWTRETCFDEAMKYKTRKEFQANCSTAYSKARENKWLDDYTWFVNGHLRDGERRRKWNYQTCHTEAMKYKTRTEFQYGKGSSRAYKTARDNGWLDDYTWFEQPQMPSGYWTYERCYDEAKNYSYLSEFRIESPSAYIIANRNNWSVDYDWLIKRRHLWTYKECYAQARKYDQRSKFKNNSPSAYYASLENEWINDYTWFEEKPRYRYWTKERCYEEALKYNNKTEFSKGSCAYSIACKSGWISDYDWLLDRRIDIIKDKIDCVYSYYFRETHTIYMVLLQFS